MCYFTYTIFDFMVSFIITGLPASGKTYFTDFLLFELSKRKKVAHIYGDAIAHISYNCTYSEKELELKYSNIQSIIDNVKQADYDILIIDDLYKRKQDFYRVKELLEDVYVVKLEALYEDLIIRNNRRPLYHRLPENKLAEYVKKYDSILLEQDINLSVNVSENSKCICKSVLLKFINEIIER